MEDPLSSLYHSPLTLPLLFPPKSRCQNRLSYISRQPQQGLAEACPPMQTRGCCRFCLLAFLRACATGTWAAQVRRQGAWECRISYMTYRTYMLHTYIVLYNYPRHACRPTLPRQGTLHTNDDSKTWHFFRVSDNQPPSIPCALHQKR